MIPSKAQKRKNRRRNKRRTPEHAAEATESVPQQTAANSTVEGIVLKTEENQLPSRTSVAVGSSEQPNENGGGSLEKRRIPLLVEIGVNLAHHQFSRDLEHVIQSAIHNGVHRLVITGTSVANSIHAMQICDLFKYTFPNALYFTAGVHPHDAKSCDHRTLDELRRLAKHSQMVAVGECGLDFDRNFSPPKVQLLWFEKQIQLAIELNKPLFLHERKASNDFVRILSQYRMQLTRGGVAHCFTGTKEELQQYLKLNLHIGITGWVTDIHRGTELFKIVKLIPKDRLMLETDAPFLLPFNLREAVNPVQSDTSQGRSQKAAKRTRNEPAFLPFVAKKVAEGRGESEEELARETTATAIRFFQLKE